MCRISEKEQVKDGEEMMNSFGWVWSQVKSREQLNFISGVQMIWILDRDFSISTRTWQLKPWKQM